MLLFTVEFDDLGDELGFEVELPTVLLDLGEALKEPDFAALLLEVLGVELKEPDLAELDGVDLLLELGLLLET